MNTVCFGPWLHRTFWKNEINKSWAFRVPGAPLFFPKKRFWDFLLFYLTRDTPGCIMTLLWKLFWKGVSVSPERSGSRITKQMDFLKKSKYPLAAYCFTGAAVIKIFQAGSIISTLYLLAYIFLAVILYTKRRDLVTVIAAVLPSALNLLSFLIYGTKFLGFVSFLVGLLMPAYVACFLLSQLEPHVGKYRDQLKRFWYAPAAASVAAFFLDMIYTFYVFAFQFGDPLGFFQSYSFLYLLSSAFLALGNLMLCHWMIFPDGIPDSWFAPKNRASDRTGLHFDMVAHVLLLLFTGGIWLYIWIYRTTKALNGTPGEEDRNPVTKLLLCIFVPFYYLYWIYKSAQRIDKLAAREGLSSDISSLCLVLAILLNIVPPIIMQEKMNAIATARGEDATPVAPSAAPADDYNNISDPIAMPAPVQRPQIAPASDDAVVADIVPANSNNFNGNNFNDKDDMKKYL